MATCGPGSGLRHRNLAGSVTAYEVLAWLIANNRQEPPAGIVQAAFGQDLRRAELTARGFSAR